MNEYLFYALLGIAAVALIGAGYWLIKVRPIYKRLKRSIREKAKAVRELNEELEQARTLFRLKKVVRGIQYTPPEMISRSEELSDLIARGIEKLSKLTFPSVEDAEWFQKQEEHYEVRERDPGFLGSLQHLTDWVFRGLWLGFKAVDIFVRDRILATLFPRPRGNLEKLRSLDEDWGKLVGYQQELLKLLLKLPGSAEFLDAKEKARLAKKEEKEQRELAAANIGQARERAELAMDYMRTRHSKKSLEIGEPPITGGATNLTQAMIESYWTGQMAKVAEMEAKGVEPAEIVGYISSTLIPNLERVFEEKAKQVVRMEFVAGELLGSLRALSEEAGRELAVPDSFKKTLEILKSEIPNLWSQARWNEFDKQLKAIEAGLESAESYLKEASEWFEDIDSIRARIAGIGAKEKRLNETYGIPMAVSPEWDKAVSAFETKALDIWSEARFEELDVLLRGMENPLKQRQYKVSNRLAEADREAGVVVANNDESSSFSAKLTQIASAGDARSSPSPRRHQQEPERKLTGNLVKIRTALGVEIEVDASIASQYKAIDAKQLEEERKRREVEKKNRPAS